MMAVKETRVRHNLPAEVTGFIGRKRELAEVKRLFATTRLLTLTGPGGVGKTRLALHAASDLARAFPDGVWLAELADLDDSALLVNVVARALGLREQSSQWLLATLSKYVADKHLLLVLDNCEHLLQACAVVTSTLLRASPELRILATSREALGIQGETTLALPSLSFPADRVPPLERLSQYEAVALFADRARAADPTFSLTEKNAALVVELCRRIDGMPLAIELAAVRLRVLSLDEIVGRLDDRFRLLTAGSRTAPHRHQTLHATIQWSYDLLTDEERVLWRRLAIFAGGFELAAGEAVCADATLPSSRVFDLVTSLVDKSILTRQPRFGRARFSMLETIRQFGRQQLQLAAEDESLARRHFDWYAQLCVDAERGMRRGRQREYIDRLEAELGNLRAALEYAQHHRETARTALLMAALLWLFWQTQGHLSEGRRWIGALLDLMKEDSPERAIALTSAATLALSQGDPQPAYDALAEAEPLAERLGDPNALAASLMVGGVASYSRGDLQGAEAKFRRVLPIYSEMDDEPSRGVAVLQIGIMRAFQGDRDQAQRLLTEAAGIGQAYGNLWLQGLAQTLLSQQFMNEAPARADALAKDGLRATWAVGDRWAAGVALDNLIFVAAHRGRMERAARLRGAVDRLWEAGAPINPPDYQAAREARDAAVSEGMGAGTYDAARTQGHAMEIEEAIAYALEEKASPASTQLHRQETGGLSRREQEIAGLVAHGMSNKQIAAKLVLSERTIETHVQNILNKLGFNSRSQVAAWAVQRDRSS